MRVLPGRERANFASRLEANGAPDYVASLVASAIFGRDPMPFKSAGQTLAALYKTIIVEDPKDERVLSYACNYPNCGRAKDDIRHICDATPKCEPNIGCHPFHPKPSAEANAELDYWTTQLPANLCINTKELVIGFAVALAEKLRAAEIKYGYDCGWMDDDWMDECRSKLLAHLDKGDPLDVAAFCAFLWHHKAPTASRSVSEAEPSAAEDALPGEQEAWQRDSMFYYSTDENTAWRKGFRSGVARRPEVTPEARQAVWDAIADATTSGESRQTVVERVVAAFMDSLYGKRESGSKGGNE